MTTVLSVGEPYHRERSSWPECAQYSYRGGVHELVVFLANPRPREVDACRSGEARFALYTHASLVVLLYEFGSGIPWSDAPYSWHLLPAAERDLPSADIEANVRVTLRVILVDAQSGIVRALRLVSLSPEFTRALNQAIRSQAAARFDPHDYDRDLGKLYQRYASTSRLLEACTVRCVGGS